jgi:hypothetical protein
MNIRAASIWRKLRNSPILNKIYSMRNLFRPNMAMQRKTPFGSFFCFGGYSKFLASVEFLEGRFR